MTPDHDQRRMDTQMDLGQVGEQDRQAADDFSGGDPGPVKQLFSHRDDVTLANPFGPAVRGDRHADASATPDPDDPLRAS